MTTPEEWERVREIFSEVLKAAPERRAAVLDELCGGDVGLRDLAKAYIIHYEKAGAERFLADRDEEPETVTADERPDARATVARAARASSETTEPPISVPDYKLFRRIGAGGFGEVWIAQNVHTLEYHAVKLVGRHREIELAGIRHYKLCAADHPHLLPIFHVSEVGDWYYYTMPLADNAVGSLALVDPGVYEPMTLRCYLNRHGQLSAPETMRIVLDLVTAIEHLHTRGATHGDVKPENILRRHGNWCLGDHSLVSSTDRSRVKGGTLGYVPPEGPGTRLADLYALGVVVFELVTGADKADLRAFRDGELARGGKDPASEQLRRIILRASEADPALRYPSARDLADALRRLDRAGRWGASLRTGAAVLAVLALASIAMIRPWNWGKPAGAGEPPAAQGISESGSPSLPDPVQAPTPTAPAVGAPDLRDAYGTRSAEAAREIDAAIKACEDGRPADGLPRARKARLLDPDCQMAAYWEGQCHVDMGVIDEGVQAWDQVIAIAERTSVTNVAVDACINAGLTLGRVGREKESIEWFSRAVLLDPDDLHKLQWRAFRNMAISCIHEGRTVSAAMCAILAYRASPENVEAGMIDTFIGAVKDDEVASVLVLPHQVDSVPQRDAAAELSDAPLTGQLDGAASDLLLDAKGRRIVIITRGASAYHVVDYAKNNEVTRIEASGPLAAATLGDDGLVVAITAPPSVAVLEVETGRKLRGWDLPAAATSIAVMPVHERAYLAVNQRLQSLDFSSGKVTQHEYPTSGLRSDPAGRFLLSYVNGEGLMLINGRPVLIRPVDRGWAQSAIYTFIQPGTRPMLAEMRLNAAADAHELHVSPDGRWLALVGRAGWRPEVQSAGSGGYGVAVLAATDLTHMVGYFEVDAYPYAAAINPVTGQIAVVREADGRVHHLSGRTPVQELKGPFGRTATWSGDGRYLYVAGGQGGVRVFKNALTKDEEEDAEGWIARTFALRPKRTAAPSPSPRRRRAVDRLTSSC